MNEIAKLLTMALLKTMCRPHKIVQVKLALAMLLSLNKASWDRTDNAQL